MSRLGKGGDWMVLEWGLLRYMHKQQLEKESWGWGSLSLSHPLLSFCITPGMSVWALSTWLMLASFEHSGL